MLRLLKNTFEPLDTPRIAAGETNTDETGSVVTGSHRALELLAGAIVVCLWAAAFAEAFTGGVN